MHINKTGGTSIESCLRFNAQRRGELRKKERHYSVRQAVEKYSDKWSEYFTFTIIRNPWDRMVSLFEWRKQVKVIPEELTFEECIMDFDYWGKFYLPNPRTGKPNVTCPNKKKLLTQPQQDWFDEEYDIDFIGRFETLQKDFNHICDRIGIRQQKLPHRYKTERGHYSEYYSKKTKNKLEEIWGKDIETFNYEFETN